VGGACAEYLLDDLNACCSYFDVGEVKTSGTEVTNQESSITFMRQLTPRKYNSDGGAPKRVRRLTGEELVSLLYNPLMQMKFLYLS
jgi:hypothetical protein